MIDNKKIDRLFNLSENNKYLTPKAKRKLWKLEQKRAKIKNRLKNGWHNLPEDIKREKISAKKYQHIHNEPRGFEYAESTRTRVFYYRKHKTIRP